MDLLYCFNFDVYNDYLLIYKDNYKFDLVIGRLDENLVVDFYVYDFIIFDYFVIYCKLNFDRLFNFKKIVFYCKLCFVNIDVFC